MLPVLIANLDETVKGYTRQFYNDSVLADDNTRESFPSMPSEPPWSN